MNYELEEELDDSNEKLGVAESRLRRCRGERDRLTARVRELEGVLEKIAITAGINTAHMEKEYVVGSLENCRAVAREALDAEKGGE